MLKFLDLNDEDSKVRRTVAEIMGKIGDNTAIPILEQALQDPENSVRRAAAESLQQFNWQPTDKTLKIKYSIVAQDWEACKDLGVEVVPGLLAALDDSDDQVRRDVVRVLGQIGDHAAIPRLSELLADNDWQIRQAAAEALGQIGDLSVTPLLLDTLRNDGDIAVRSSTAKAILHLGDFLAITDLFAVLKDKRVYERSEIIRALGEVGDATVGAKLVELLRDEDDQMRLAAVEGLGHIKDPSTVPGLLAIFEGESLSIQHAILNNLKNFGTIEALAILEPEIDELFGTWDGIYLQGKHETPFTLTIKHLDGNSFRGTTTESGNLGNASVHGIQDKVNGMIEFTKQYDNQNHTITYLGEVIARNFVAGTWSITGMTGEFYMRKIQ